jgi:hypothetical protein
MYRSFHLTHPFKSLLSPSMIEKMFLQLIDKKFLLVVSSIGNAILYVKEILVVNIDLKRKKS